MTVSSITKNALLAAGKIDPLKEPDADEIAAGLAGLNRLRAYWAGLAIFIQQQLTRTASVGTAKASYTIANSSLIVLLPQPPDITYAQPIHMLDVALWTGTTSKDRTLRRCDETEWARLPLRNAAGTPIYYYYQRGPVVGTLYVSPILASGTGKNLVYVAMEPLTDITALDVTSDVQIPAEWEIPLTRGLLGEIGRDFGVPAAEAEAARAEALGLAKGLIA